MLHLAKVLDSMLEKAGIGENTYKEEITTPTYLHKLLELVETEQNIYNVIFHELIRQVNISSMYRV